MLKNLIPAVALSLLASAAAAEPAYVASPLLARVPAAPGAKPFEVLSPDETGLSVSNVYNDPRMWGDRFRELTLGAVETGIAVADFFRDGHLDIFVVSRNGPCALYRQTSPFKFVNCAGASGVDCTQNGPGSVTSATVVDINQDGWPDLYVCRFGAPNLLFVNNGDGTFTERAKEYGLDVTDASVEATFADYDGDGYLDCFLLTNVLDFSKSPLGRRNYLFHNNGNGTFTDVSKKAGIWGTTQGHTAIWFDANQDGWPDIYVANDFETPDRFYMNNGDGTFTDVVDERLPHVTYFSMGADSGDLMNNGLIDFMVTDMRDRTHEGFMKGLEEMGRGLWEMERVEELIPQYMWNATYLNTGTDRYQEISHLIGVNATGWTWAVRMADLMNNGRQDLFFTGGMIRNFTDPDLVDKQNIAPNLNARAMVWKNSPPRRESTLAYENLGDLKFQDVSSKWGLDQVGVSFGCAIVDVAGDGNLDIVYNNYDAPPTIIRNHSVDGHRVMIKLDGRAPNRDAIGAELRIETAGGIQVHQIYTERGVVASEPATVHFGLGKDTEIGKLTIHWPNGQLQELEDLPVDVLLTIKQPELAPGETAHRAPAKFNRPPNPGALFVENAHARGLDFTDSAQPADEFTRQRLLPRRQSSQRIGLPRDADVNGDGILDIFVSGTDGQAGVLYLGQPGGGYKAAPEQPWADVKDADDVGAIFLDATGGGHADLFITSGGVRRDRGDPGLGSRLYLNDGKGRFTLAPAATIPANGESTAVAAAACDFEGTGRQGLFVGGRVVHWPATPSQLPLPQCRREVCRRDGRACPGTPECRHGHGRGLGRCRRRRQAGPPGRDRMGPHRLFPQHGSRFRGLDGEGGARRKDRMVECPGRGRPPWRRPPRHHRGQRRAEHQVPRERGRADRALRRRPGRQRPREPRGGAVRERDALSRARAQQAGLRLPLDHPEVPQL